MSLSPSLFLFSVLGFGLTLPMNGPGPGSFRPMIRWFPYHMADFVGFCGGLATACAL
jgi:hypothetical protein